MAALETLALAPGTDIAINGLTDTAQTLNPMLRYLGPYETVCDGWNYFWKSTHLPELSDALIDVIADHAFQNGLNSSFSVPGVPGSSTVWRPAACGMRSSAQPICSMAATVG